MTDDLDEESRSGAAGESLIRAYGEYWSRVRVDWQRSDLRGVLKGKLRVNGWKQRGIYALYDHFKLVYVGQAESRDLGQRLREHLTDRFAERWDSFSWFGVYGFHAKTGEPIEAQPKVPDQRSVIRSMELIAILLTDAPLNRAQGKFPGSEKVWQRDREKNSERSVEERLLKLRTDLDELGDAVLTRSKKTGKRN